MIMTHLHILNRAYLLCYDLCCYMKMEAEQASETLHLFCIQTVDIIEGNVLRSNI